MAARIYVLLTWTTRDRQPLVTGAIEQLLTRLLPKIAGDHGANTLAVGMVKDHVHMLLRLPLRFDVPGLVQRLKGPTARVANRDAVATHRLGWARGYDLRSISVRALRQVRQYVREQKRRHGRLIESSAERESEARG